MDRPVMVSADGTWRIFQRASDQKHQIMLHEIPWGEHKTLMDAVRQVEAAVTHYSHKVKGVYDAEAL